MHIIYSLVSILFLVGAGFYYQDDLENAYNEIAYFSFCENPVGFHVESVDPKFGVDKETVVEQAKTGADIWNSQSRSVLFEYNPESELDLHLIFDERQRKANEVSSRETTVEIEKVSLSERVGKYESQYESLNNAINELEEKVEYWNSRGGAPIEIFDKLIDQQNKLNKSIEDLNKVAGRIDAATSAVNSKIDNLNNSISEFNNLLDVLPEEGLYIPVEEKIEIYFYDSEKRFSHTVAHELGHALGLMHVMAESAIMHPTTSNNSELTQGDISELDSFCKEQNKFEFLKDNFEMILSNQLKKLQARST